MNVVCIGAGYVGSVTAAAFAVIGHSVTVVDLDPGKIGAIRQGNSPVYEPGLDGLIRTCAGSSLRASPDYGSVYRADVVFICVGTPSRADSSADLTYVKEAAAQIGNKLDPQRYTVIVNKSTVPVGTKDLVGSIIGETSGLQEGAAFDVVSNPEFLREGYAVEDVFYPERILIGTDSPKAEQVMKKLYDPILTESWDAAFADLLPPLPEPGRRPVWLCTSPKSAELIKYASNAFLAVKISYMNEMARLCDVLGSNVSEVAAGMGLDSRIGSKFLQVSSGWSGSCFPKDTAELLETSRKYGRELAVVKAAVESNDRMHRYALDKVQARLKSLQGKTIGIWGLTFKPNTDDVRKTQATTVIRLFLDLGCRIRAHDPKGMEMFRQLNPGLPVQYCGEPEEAAEKADALILLTHWDRYLHMDWKTVGETMRFKYVLDTRNVLPGDLLRQNGFVYEGFGI